MSSQTSLSQSECDGAGGKAVVGQEMDCEFAALLFPILCMRECVCLCLLCLCLCLCLCLYACVCVCVNLILLRARTHNPPLFLSSTLLLLLHSPPSPLSRSHALMPVFVCAATSTLWRVAL